MKAIVWIGVFSAAILIAVGCTKVEEDIAPAPAGERGAAESEAGESQPAEAAAGAATQPPEESVVEPPPDAEEGTGTSEGGVFGALGRSVLKATAGVESEEDLPDEAPPYSP